MKNLKRNVIAFLIAFLFIQVCGIYVMGGPSLQTIESKITSMIIGIGFGILVVFALVINENAE